MTAKTAAECFYNTYRKKRKKGIFFTFVMQHQQAQVYSYEFILCIRNCSINNICFDIMDTELLLLRTFAEYKLTT